MKTARIAAALLLTLPLTGCLVMGYSTRGGWYVWPWSIVLTLVAVALYYFTRSR
jgi:hypothetical protein